MALNRGALAENKEQMLWKGRSMKKQKDIQNDHFRVDEDGRIWAKNPSAWWLPDIAFEQEIDRTVFSVTASYAGTETLNRKLRRIMAEEAKDSFRDPGKGGDS